MRTRDIIRHNKYRVIARKKRIIKEQNGYWHYKYSNELSKGKIHCSCPLCRHKSYDYTKVQDIRSRMSLIDSMESTLIDTDMVIANQNSLRNRLNRRINARV